MTHSSPELPLQCLTTAAVPTCDVDVLISTSLLLLVPRLYLVLRYSMRYLVSSAAVHSRPVAGGLFVFPQNSYVGPLIPSVMVPEPGAFERKLGLDEVMRAGPS